MRTRKPTKGKVSGIKFGLSEEKDDLKKAKEQAQDLLKEQEKNDKEWYDKELDKNLKK